MRVLIDADLVLERLLLRSKFVEKAEWLFKYIVCNGSIETYITDIGLEKIRTLSSQLAKKNKKQKAEKVVALLQNKYKFKICQVDEFLLTKARKIDLIDFESAIEIACAINNNFYAIVTEAPQKFSGVSSFVLIERIYSYYHRR